MAAVAGLIESIRACLNSSFVPKSSFKAALAWWSFSFAAFIRTNFASKAALPFSRPSLSSFVRANSSFNLALSFLGFLLFLSSPREFVSSASCDLFVPEGDSIEVPPCFRLSKSANADTADELMLRVALGGVRARCCLTAKTRLGFRLGRDATSEN